MYTVHLYTFIIQQASSAYYSRRYHRDIQCTFKMYLFAFENHFALLFSNSTKIHVRYKSVHFLSSSSLSNYLFSLCLFSVCRMSVVFIFHNSAFVFSQWIFHFPCFFALFRFEISFLDFRPRLAWKMLYIHCPTGFWIETSYIIIINETIICYNDSSTIIIIEFSCAARK